MVFLVAAENTIYGFSLMKNADLQSRKMMGSSPSAHASAFGNFPAGKITRVGIVLIV